MSIITSYEVDQSAALAKRYASLAATFLSNPSAGKTKEAQIPLENLFRILEMYRYEAFSDENRRGILAVRGFENAGSRVESEDWQTPIVAALETALNEAFDLSTTSKEAAIDALVAVLQDLAVKGEVVQETAQPTKIFLASLEKALAA
jgi:hypothetical protein